MSRARLNTQLEVSKQPNMILASNSQNGANEMVYKEFNTTLANLKTSTNLFYPFVVITDIGKEGMFKYDSTDTTSVNDDIYMIVDGAGKRYKRTSDIVDTKLHKVLTIANLQTYTQSILSYFDGSIWEKKGGNVVSNGGTFAGTIIQVNTSFYWERKVENYVYPEWFGANTANTNNSAELQKTIDYAIANNFSVKLTRKAGGSLGLYKITSPLTISNRISIIGDGINYCGIFCIGCHGFVISEGVNNVTIKDLAIIAGTRYTTTVHNFIAIQTLGTFASQNYWHIYKDLFLDGFRWGIQCPYTWSTTINSVTSVFCGGGINAPGQSVNNFVSQCQFTGNNESASIGIQLGDGAMVIEGWGITDCLIANFAVGIQINGGSNITIRGNIIDFFSQRGIFLQSNAIGASMNCTISENYLACSAVGSTGIWLLNNFAGSISQNRGNTISDNQILFYSPSSLAYGIYVSGTAEISNTITGNKIEATSFDLRVTTGINTVVSNNNFKGAGYFGDIAVNYYGNRGIIQSSAVTLFQSNGKTKIYYDSVIPTTGTYTIGDILYNVTPAPSVYVGWVCTVSGTPGTWKGFGLIQT